MVIRRS
jgi:hypothetical protein